MTIHLSARLTWHDTGWDGRVCRHPLDNVYCVVHDHIRDSRNDEQEVKHAGMLLAETDYRPPCSRDPGVYSPTGYRIVHNDPLEWRSLPSVAEDLLPYTVATSPYGHMFSEGETDTWEYDAGKQLENLKQFFGELSPGRSLVFFYLKDGQPFLETSQRVVVGMGRIKKIGPQVYFQVHSQKQEEGQQAIGPRRSRIHAGLSRCLCDDLRSSRLCCGHRAAQGAGP